MTDHDIVTVSFNYMNTRDVLGIKDNSPDIIASALFAATMGKPFYHIYNTWRGCEIAKTVPGGCRNLYLGNYRLGKYEWVYDYTYAKHFSRKTALKHIYELMKRDGIPTFRKEKD